MSRDLEKKIEAYLCKEVNARGGVALKLGLDKGRGFPDRTLILKDGTVVFVECKRPTGSVVSAHQKLWVEKLKSLKTNVYIVSSYADIDTLVSEYHD